MPVVGGGGSAGPAGPTKAGSNDPTTTVAKGTAGPGGPTNNQSTTGVTASKISSINSQGWYIFGAITAGIVLGNTAAGPVVFGILTLALLYQTSLLLEGK